MASVTTSEDSTDCELKHIHCLTRSLLPFLRVQTLNFRLSDLLIELLASLTTLIHSNNNLNLKF